MILCRMLCCACGLFKEVGFEIDPSKRQQMERGCWRCPKCMQKMREEMHARTDVYKSASELGLAGSTDPLSTLYGARSGRRVHPLPNDESDPSWDNVVKILENADAHQETAT